MTGGFATEQELARPVVRWLQQLRYDVFQEVSTGSGVADVVATQGRLLLTVETKLSLNFDVIAQACAWRPYAHLSYVAVPAGVRYSDGRRLAEHVCKMLGVGVLLVYHSTTPQAGFNSRTVHEQVKPMLARSAAHDHIRRWLRPEQKTGEFGEAGASGGGHYTNFKGTARALGRLVKSEPGIELSKVIEQIDHHYATPASARTHLAQWIERGIIEGIELRREGRKLRLYPKEKTDAVDDARR